MLSVNNQRRPSVDTNVTPNVGLRRPTNEQDSHNHSSSTYHNGRPISPSASQTLTGNATPDGPYSTLEARSRSPSVSSAHSLIDYSTANSHNIHQLEQNLQRLNLVNITENMEPRNYNSPSPIVTNVDCSTLSSPTNSITSITAASLTRKDHITGHTHDRSRSTSIDGDIEYSTWSMDKVEQWLDANSFSDYKKIFVEQELCGERFFKLGNYTNAKNLLKGDSESRSKLITAIRKLGEGKQKRHSSSEKGSQDDTIYNSPSASSSSSLLGQNSPSTQNISTLPISTPPNNSNHPLSPQNKTLKSSTSSIDLRSTNLKNSTNNTNVPIITPRSSSIGWEKNHSSSNSTISQIEQPISSSNIDNGHTNDTRRLQTIPQNENSFYANQPVMPQQDQYHKSDKKRTNTNKSIAHNRARSYSSGDNMKYPPINFLQQRNVSNISNTIPQRNIQITEDMTNFIVVNITSCQDLTSIINVIFSRLKIEQSDREDYAFHVAEIGQEIGPIISNEDLLQKCLSADAKASLKLLVKRIQPPESYYAIPHPHKKLTQYSSQSELDQISSNNNNITDDRKFRFPGGFNPLIKGWNGLSPEIIPISEEPSDINKFSGVKFPVPFIDHQRSTSNIRANSGSSSQNIYAPAPDYNTSSRPAAYEPYSKNHRKLASEDNDFINNQDSSSPSHGIVHDIVHDNSLSQRINHSQVLQPAGRRSNNTGRDNMTQNVSSQIQKTNSHPQSYSNLQSPHQNTLTTTIPTNVPYGKLSKSQPHLPLNHVNDNPREIYEPEQRYQLKQSGSSEPDLTLRKVGKSQPLRSSASTPVAKRSDDDISLWAEKPKPTQKTSSSHVNQESPIVASPSLPDRNSPIDNLNRSINTTESKKSDSTLIVQSDESKKTLSSSNGQSNVFKRPGSVDSAISLSQNSSSENINQTDNRTNNKDLDATLVSDEQLSNQPKPTKPSQKRSTGGLARTVSKRRGVKVEESWVERPTAEDVFDNIEQYFPDHDIDMPIVGAQGNMNTVSENEDSTQATPSPNVAEKTGAGAKIARGKSIRVAVHEAKERERRERRERSKMKEAVNKVVKQQRQLHRKPTTKLWDKKVVEERPSNKKIPSLPNSKSYEESAERKPVKWVKGELIGKGTFGKVFLAMNLTSSEMMAVKQIELPKTKHDQRNERQKTLIKAFKDEMEILKDLDHEHIVTYIGYEENDDTVNIFLEYVNGGSIGTVLRTHGAFKESVVRSFTRQILLGLQYLHDKNILHRDIKSDNILVDEEGCCKISDFGISKKNEQGIAYDYNSNMSLQGTIFWMAPEVFTAGYSAKVDIWSLGCVVLEMFAGERPWPNLSDLAAIFKLGSEKKSPPIREDIVMSNDARDFLNKCFIIEPNDRPTAKQLLSHPFAEENSSFYFKEFITIPGRSS
ncbi:10280_t:CDS:10 [Diversispora eburnea]|uniref:10280_t:CDS:1 n=1 Tax=Diversispora eburnea TaxID=1213867 RepID=A0A9N9F8Q8_9GLOM|nr:10280_t:CDS:10 [Diversispora eburnea]